MPGKPIWSLLQEYELYHNGFQNPQKLHCVLHKSQQTGIYLIILTFVAFNPCLIALEVICANVKYFSSIKTDDTDDSSWTQGRRQINL